MTGVEEETVTTGPCGILWVVNEEFTEEHIDEVGSSHGSAGVTRLGLFYHGCSENTDIVGCLVH